MQSVHYRILRSHKDTLHGNTVEEGSYVVGKESQQVLFTPLGSSEVETLRYVNDVIYGGKEIALANQRSYLLKGFIALGITIYDEILVDGEIYDSDLLKEVCDIKEDKVLFSSLADLALSEEKSNKALIGWYDDSLLSDGFVVCLYKDDVDEENGIHGMWADEYAYSKVYFPVGSVLYEKANKALANLKEAKSTYPERQYEKAVSLLDGGDYQKAYDIFSSIIGYKDVNNILENNTNIKKIKYQTGNIINFGNYKGEPISWIILDADGDKRLLLAEKVIDTAPYNSIANSPWSRSYIHNWLNGAFIDLSFDENETEDIVLSEIDNPANPIYNIGEETNTKDYVFFLSYEEFKRYLKDKPIAKAIPTDYAKRMGVDTVGDECDKWWLRTAGKYEEFAMCVDSGKADTNGVPKTGYYNSYSSNQLQVGIRPAMWIDIG